MIDARTRSISPACKATVAMISSGALPKVAFRRPPTASPVRVEICSVAWTIRLAAGMMASAAEKKTRGGAAWARSSASETGMNASSQLIEGFNDSRRTLTGGETSVAAIGQVCRRLGGGALALWEVRGASSCGRPMPG